MFLMKSNYLILNHDVTTMTGKTIAGKGEELNDKFMNKIASMRQKNIKMVPVFDVNGLKEDICSLMYNDNYRFVFNSKERVEKTLFFLKQIQLPEPVYDILLYFKEKDSYTYRHSLSVASMLTLMASEFYSPQQIIDEVAIGPVHDIGKIAIPLSILQKKTPLTYQEFDIMKNHCSAGYVLMSYYMRDHKPLICRAAYEHHERVNGSGYPRGIFLKHPMLELVVGCDIFDALISPRPYRTSNYDNRTALEVLTDEAVSGRMSWETVKILISYHRQSKPSCKDCDVSMEKRGIIPSGNNYGKFIDEK